MRTLPPRSRVLPLGLAALVLAAGLTAAGLLADRRGEQAPAARQAEVAARGRTVMPFDLDRTTHVFQDLADGGRQTVTADDPADRRQVTLIQEHLRREAAAFRRGDFTDPAAIHGNDMPGLATLKAGVSQITVRYRALTDGAELRYTTGHPALVAAIHVWFQAQTTDHGGHAEQR